MNEPHLTFVTSLPPSVNHSHRNYTTPAGRRRRVPTGRAMTWTRDARLMAKAAMATDDWTWTCPQGEPVVVDYFVWWPDRRRRDPSNLEKLMLDALTGVAYDDDKWAIPRCVGFGYDKAAPRLVVRCRRQAGETVPKWCHAKETDHEG